jgi:hypothetical protein
VGSVAGSWDGLAVSTPARGGGDWWRVVLFRTRRDPAPDSAETRALETLREAVARIGDLDDGHASPLILGAFDDLSRIYERACIRWMERVA